MNFGYSNELLIQRLQQLRDRGVVTTLEVRSPAFLVGYCTVKWIYILFNSRLSFYEYFFFHLSERALKLIDRIRG